MMQFFEWDLPPDGLLWDRAACLAPEIKESGIDILWLPPAYKGAAGMADTGYGVYDMYDLGEFDQKGTVPTKYGTRDEYLAAIHALQTAGIKVVADMVMNHRLGADATQPIRAVRVDPDDRTKTISGEYDIDAWTRFFFPGRRGKYSRFEWDWQCFTGVDYDQRSGQGGIYRFADRQWSSKVDGEKGNYDYLMGADVDVNHPETSAELVRWGQWYCKTTGVDGFRLDALKHLDHDFVHRWLGEMRNGCPKEMFAVGEYWSENLEVLLGFLKSCGYCLRLFDVPLHMSFMRASQAGGGYDMASLFSGSLVSREAMHAVTFVDNHDSQPGQALESWVEEWFKPLAYACILLRLDGLPCVFYADYYGLRADGVPAVPDLRRMLRTRRDYAYGEQHDYFDNPDIVGWTREGDREHPNSGIAVVLTDRQAGEKWMYIGRHFAKTRFRDVIARLQQPVEVQEDGYARFSTVGGGVSVWVTEEAYRKIEVQCE